MEKEMSEIKRLKDVAHIYDSLHQTPQYIASSDYRIIRVVDIKEGALSLEKSLFVDYETYLNYTKKYIPKEGDIIITRVGSYGICSYINTNKRFCLGQNLALINPKINCKYLYYCLISPDIKNQIENMVVGTTQKTISLFNISNLKIHIPDCTEQDLVANILSSFDDKIELNNRIIENLEEQAQSLYKHWFVDFEFPDKDGKPYKSNGGKFKESELGLIPEDWTIKYLNKLLNFERGSEPGNKNYIERSDKTIPYIRVGEMDCEKSLYIDSAFLDENKYAHPGKVLVSFDGTVGKVVYWRDAMFSGGIRMITSNVQEINDGFIYFIFKTERIQNEIKKYEANRTTITHASAAISEFKVAYNDETFKKYSEVVKPMFEQMVNIMLENQKLAEARDYLLPKLMKGEIKVGNEGN